MTTPAQTNLQTANTTYATTFTHGALPLPPSKHYALLTCMDARIDVFSAFGLAPGHAHVIRNAGASARDALRSLIISQQLLGTTEVLVIKHTGCGMLTFGNEDARGVVRERLGDEAGAEVEGMDFLPFADLEEAVREDVEWLRGQKTVGEGVVVSGWVYEVESGRVRAVE